MFQKNLRKIIRMNSSPFNQESSYIFNYGGMMGSFCVSVKILGSLSNHEERDDDVVK